jgi:hypothetical protein
LFFAFIGGFPFPLLEGEDLDFIGDFEVALAFLSLGKAIFFAFILFLLAARAGRSDSIRIATGFDEVFEIIKFVWLGRDN